MRDGTLDVKNLKVGDKVDDNEECVAILCIAIIKHSGSEKLEPIPEFDFSRDFRFKDFIPIMDQVKERFVQLEPTRTEMEDRNKETNEYLNKMEFNADKKDSQQ
jgi:hypothetical protein